MIGLICNGYGRRSVRPSSVCCPSRAINNSSDLPTGLRGHTCLQQLQLGRCIVSNVDDDSVAQHGLLDVFTSKRSRVSWVSSLNR